MNRTQKTAWLNVSGFLMGIILLSYPLIMILVFRRLPNRIVVAVLLLVFAAQLGWWIFLLRSKQSSAEPEADERDKAIMRNAVLVSFVSTWLLLAAATLLPMLLLGPAGSLPVFLLPLINMGVFCLAVLVYFAGVLVQYRRGGEHGQ
ncbi:MAG: hypothetical protein ACYSWO_04090 [Planctomycetota bacterium]